MTRWLNLALLGIARRILEHIGKVADRTTDTRLLESLASIRYTEILTPVALNPATPPETLCGILDDEYSWGGEEETRVHLSWNPALPLPRLVAIMRTDESEYVRAAAACALAGRLVAEPARDPGLVSECREFLIELRSRDEYDSVERFLELLEPSSGDASESS